MQSFNAMKRKRSGFDECRTLPKHDFGLGSAPLLTASFDVAYLVAVTKITLHSFRKHDQAGCCATGKFVRVTFSSQLPVDKTNSSVQRQCSQTYLKLGYGVVLQLVTEIQKRTPNAEFILNWMNLLVWPIVVILHAL